MGCRVTFTIGVLLSVSLCVGVEGLPDPNVWFIQPLGWDMPWAENLQVSDRYVVWEGDYGGLFGTFHYDGTGIYQLGCYNPSLSGSSIVGAAGPNILFFHQGDTELLTSGQYDHLNPDVYERQVIWEGGSGGTENTGIYYYCYDYPVAGVMQLTAMGKCPQVSENAIAWLGWDGEDYEVFLLKDNTVQQLTFNNVDEFDLRMSDDGQLAWMTWVPTYEYTRGYVHYYDGEHIRQLTVGNTHSWLRGISEMGVLYTSEFHPFYPDYSDVLMFHDGTEERLIFHTDSSNTGQIARASIGGNSIAWIAQLSHTEDMHLYFLQGDELISWSLPNAPMAEEMQIGVWGNRLAWTPQWGALYFAEYEGGPACVDPPKMDGNGDCRVDLLDFATFASEWLTCGYDDQDACWQLIADIHL